MPRTASEEASASMLLSRRMLAIVHALGGRDAGTNGEELWFETDAGVQVRLGHRDQPRCFDRSANFAISYGARATADPDAGRLLPTVTERVKSVDAHDLPGARADAESFRRAAEAAARELGAHRDPAGGPPQRTVWEHPRMRRQHAVFLDLCARLLQRPGETLLPLHWGFWPSPDAEAAADYDPWLAYSRYLLSLIPAGCERILDVGCGLGFNARLLSAQGKQVTAVSPVAHHCETIEGAALPGVEVVCARFEEMTPGAPHDLLLFSESLNHFPLDTAFFEHCRAFLRPSGWLLAADDLAEERAGAVETQPVFRLVRRADISANVAPTHDWWKRQMPAFAAAHTALMSVLALEDAELAARVRAVVDGLDSAELRLLFSGELAAPISKGRYMAYLLQRD